MTIWCNAEFTPVARLLLEEGVRSERLVYSEKRSSSVLAAAERDPQLAGADIAFGQPDSADCLEYPNLKWVELSSAGYTRFDHPAFREAFLSRGSFLTNASGVFADPCAQHVLALMLAGSRQLYPAYQTQLTDKAWHYEERRSAVRLLTGQTAVLLGFGSIGRRLAELLSPFGMKLYAVRRRIHSEPGVRIVPEEELTRILPLADHVVNLLPANEETQSYVNARRIACFRQGACFYNVGRGTTVDQGALIQGLESGRIGSAYLDVMEPEPLPADHPLWTTPRCYLTPHAAGGRPDQDEALVLHFLRNLKAFKANTALEDRVL